MKSVAVTGYYSTGTGAAIDLLKEYSSVDLAKFGEKNYEQIFLYDINGVFDTVDRLLNFNNLLNSNAIINQFRAEMYRLNDIDFGWFGGYKKLCGDKFINIIEEFIDEITEYHLKADWYGTYEKRVLSVERIIKDTAAVFLKRRKINKGFGKKTVMDRKNRNEFSFATAVVLQNATQKLISRYLDIFFDKDKIAVLDHLLMPQDAKRVEKFTPPDFKLIIVDRDIRDLYMYNKYIWNEKWGDGSYFPTNIDDFVRFTRAYRSTEEKVFNDRILRIQFEDLIYKYDETVKLIEDFVGIENKDHIFTKKHFDPGKSIKNTQLFNLNAEWKKESELIKEALPELIYNFPFANKTSVNELFDG